MIVVGSLIVFFYTLTMALIYFGFRSVPSMDFPQEQKEKKTRFSILVPFRNEAENLNLLLESLKSLNYPTDCYETIFINDGSTDNSEEIIHQALQDSGLHYTVTNNDRTTGSPKKDAITKAITLTLHEWIMTTDADCRLHAEILDCYDRFIQYKEPYMIVGPIGLVQSTGLNYYFQLYEHLALQTFTAGGFGLKAPFLCNGANLVYLKDKFLQLGGFMGNDHIPSGDDIFLFEKFRKRYPNKLHYVRSYNAIVFTTPLKNWKAIIEQRVRWASKITSQKNPFSRWVGLIVFLTNLWLIVGLLYSLFNPDHLINYLIVLFHKLLVDLIIITSSSQFLTVRIHLLAFIINSLRYPFISVWIAIRSLNGKYSWKERHYNKPLI